MDKDKKSEIDFKDWILTDPEHKLNNERGGVAWSNVKRSDNILMSHKKNHGFMDFVHSFDFIVNEIMNLSPSSRVLFTLWRLKKSNGNILNVYIDKYKGSDSEYRLVFHQRVNGDNTFKSVTGAMQVGHRYNVSLEKKGETFSLKILWEESSFFESGDLIGFSHRYDEMIIAESPGYTIEPDNESSGFLSNLKWVNIVPARKRLDNPMSLFNSVITHETIVEYSGGLFGDGHYDDSVNKAFKQIELMVKTKTSSVLSGESGRSLMGKAFSATHPVLKINDLKTQSEIDEQSGFCQIFMGSMIGIRNPVVHENVSMDVKRALHLLSLANLLAEIVDQSKLAPA